MSSYTLIMAVEILTHIDALGKAAMVDISEKKITVRTAIASGEIHMNTETLALIESGAVKKGDVLAAARIAGIMAVKNTSSVIPLCHSILLEQSSIDFKIISRGHSEQLNKAILCVFCTVKVNAKTGAEMEALNGVVTALLTVYDMCKAVDSNMILNNIKLEEKTGGKHGHWRRIK